MHTRTIPLALALALAATGCSGLTGPNFETIIDDCGLNNHHFVEVGDDGDTLIFSTENKDKLFGVDLEDQECLLGALETPDHILSQMGSTRALDGQQSASWDGLTMHWNYHPNSGTNITITKGEQ